MRALLALLLFGNGVAVLLCSLALILLALSPILEPLGDAFGLAFVGHISLLNDSGQPVLVTPIGATGRAGRRRSLPVVRGERDASYSDQNTRFMVKPGEMLTIWYDWDDVNLSELVLEDEAGHLGQVVVNERPTNNQYSPPLVEVVSICPPKSWTPPPPEVKQAFATSVDYRPEPWLRRGVNFLLLVGPFTTFAPLLRAYRRGPSVGNPGLTSA